MGCTTSSPLARAHVRPGAYAITSSMDKAVAKTAHEGTAESSIDTQRAYDNRDCCTADTLVKTSDKVFSGKGLQGRETLLERYRAIAGE